MADIGKESSVIRVVELGNRAATVLEHDTFRVMVDDIGGMIPELSGSRGQGWLNAHWMPWFRSSQGKPYKDTEHGAFWKSNLLYHIAGAFPCLPNFGSGHIIDGVSLPPHGWTANQNWKFVTKGNDETTGAAWALSVMDSPDKAMPLSFSKLDVLIPGQPVHYSSIRVKNSGPADIEICAAWHNTLGAPFLNPGCRISGAAKTWMTPPPGGEFDTTTRLALGAEFASLDQAPLMRGGTTDISRVCAPMGYTDFAVGAIPDSACLGWSSLVNPDLQYAYICFFTGPKAAAADDIILYFNELWMQYGGRLFTPWAPYEGAADLTYCLGQENAVAAYAYGLEYSRSVKSLQGAPTTVRIPAMGQKTLRYGTLFAPYIGTALDQGIHTVEGEEKRLVCTGAGESWTFNADPGFTVLKGLERRHK
jgi:hypothetical protein